MLAKSLAVLVVPLLIPVMQAGVVGKPEVVDGVTMNVGESVVRLYGLLAPSADQTCQRGGETVACGAEAKATLERLIGDADVMCTNKGTDRQKRLLATCTAGGIDLNRGMVRSGWARADRDETAMFAAFEAEPREAKAGLWQDDLVVSLR